MTAIEITNYARLQMLERELPEEWIQDLISNPPQVIAGSQGRQIAQKKVIIGGKEQLLRVIFEQDEDRIIVVTAYTTSRVAKYWREA
jgi:hypothetical protein